MARRRDDPRTFARWPLLLAAVTLMGAGVGLDLATQAPIAYGLWVLAASCLGAFIYAEGARHREWWRRDLDDEPGPLTRREADPPPLERPQEP